MNWYKKAQEEPEEPKEQEEIDIDDIAEKNKGGDCYQVSGEYLMDMFLQGNKNLLLVHGEVTGQGAIEGIKYGHAWIEDGQMVIDKSQGRSIKLPKHVYYVLGNIDESKVIKYNYNQMTKKILETEHWGPWD